MNRCVCPGEEGTFSDIESALACEQKTVCIAGEEVVSEGGASSNRSCQICENDRFDHDDDPETPCFFCQQGTIEDQSVCRLHLAEDGPISQGETVFLKGVTATSGLFYISDNRTGFYVSDLPLTAFSGILVTSLSANTPNVEIGDVLDMEGIVREFGSSEASGTETQFEATSVVILRTGTAPDALVLSSLEVLGSEALGEPYEGGLVTISNIHAVETSLGFGQWSVSDGTTTVVVDNDFYTYPVLEGEVFSSITGLIRYSVFAPGQFILNPRSSEDIVSSERPTTRIGQLRDETRNGYIAPCPDGQFSGCGDAVLSSMVVCRCG